MAYETIIKSWPNYDALALDLGVRPGLVANWKLRDSIPAAYWHRLVQAAATRGISLTLHDLAMAAEMAAGLSREGEPDDC